LAFLDQRERAVPLFLWVHLLDPHSPYDPGPELEAKVLAGVPHPTPLPERLRHEFVAGEPAPSAADLEVIRALYRGDVERTDRALAPLLERLRATASGEREAFTLLTADHGEQLGEHNDYVGHTAWLHEEMLRVPFLVHNSRGRDAGAVWTYPAFGPDVAPTLLELAEDSALDAEVARMLGTGGGAVPLLDPEVRVFIERLRSEGKHARIELRLLVSESFAPEGFFDQRAARLGPLKEVVEAGPERPGGFFDLAADPGEARSIEGDGRFDALAKLLERWHVEHGEIGAAERTEVPVDEATRAALDKLGYTDGMDD